MQASDAMTADDRDIAENIAKRSANEVADRMVAQIQNETKMLAEAVRMAALAEIEKTRQQIETARMERRAEIQHHADTCPTVQAFASARSAAFGGWRVLVLIAATVMAVVGVLLHFVKF